MIGIVLKGLRAALVADGDISAAVGSRVYSVIAPQSAALPYIVINVAAGGTDNTNQRDSMDVMMQVKALAATAQAAMELADHIRDALHRQELALDAPWSWYSTHHDSAFFYDEQVDREQFFHAGATYRVRAVKV